MEWLQPAGRGVPEPKRAHRGPDSQVSGGFSQDKETVLSGKQTVEACGSENWAS